MRNRTRGFTLIEVMISLAILAIIVLAIYALIETGSTSYNSTARKDTLERNARNALERLAEELRLADPGSVKVPLAASGDLAADGSTILTFRKAESYTKADIDPNTGAILNGNNGQTNYGQDVSYFVEASGADANNNGNSKDDARLVRSSFELQKDGSYKLVTSTICDYLQISTKPDGSSKLTGFSVTHDGAKAVITLRLHITNGKYVNGEPQLIEVTATTTVLYRNRQV